MARCSATPVCNEERISVEILDTVFSRSFAIALVATQENLRKTFHPLTTTMAYTIMTTTGAQNRFRPIAFEDEINSAPSRAAATQAKPSCLLCRKSAHWVLISLIFSCGFIGRLLWCRRTLARLM